MIFVALSDNKIPARGLGPRRFDFLSDFNLMLIGLDRFGACVVRFFCDDRFQIIWLENARSSGMVATR
jgi:hypothetical protein